MQAALPTDAIVPVWVTLRSAEKLQGDFWPVQGRDLGSPDGCWLAHLSGRELSVLDGADLPAASVRLPPELAAPQIAMWSPDGRYIVVVDQSPACALAGAAVALVEWRRVLAPGLSCVQLGLGCISAKRACSIWPMDELSSPVRLRRRAACCLAMSWQAVSLP